MSKDALVITTVAVPGGGTLGLTHCPGRCGGAYGHRDLDRDLAAIEAWGASMLISLVEAHEFEHLGVPGFVADVQRYGFTWQHVPIPDFGTPDDAALALWRGIAPDVVAVLDRGGRIVLHCAAGRGRTGMIAAKILVERGMAVDAAIAVIRARRPGAIETENQASFVGNGPRLL